MQNLLQPHLASGLLWRRGTREEPGTLTQGAPVFPGSSRLGIEPKTPGWLVQDPTTSPSGDLIPTIRGSGAHPGLEGGKLPSVAELFSGQPEEDEKQLYRAVDLYQSG